MLDVGTSTAALPSVDAVLRTDTLGVLCERYRREPLVRAVRTVLHSCREEVLGGAPVPTLIEVALRVQTRIEFSWQAAPRPVINATGVILHTNLGRAPLSRAAITAMERASSYGDLEYDLSSGQRGTRQGRIAELISDLVGAEDALVTVNNASAILLSLAALTRGKEVLVSRGQAVEIGGGFRVPSILRLSGARLVDVGTTNKTRVDDYEDAITPRTIAILDVHPSNFRMSGFVEQADTRDMASFARQHGLIFICDNGSGALVDTCQYGLRHEPMPSEALSAGADLVTFSADKLIGGPQAGIVAGRADLIARLRSHQLARAIRPDKLTLAALSATLGAYVEARESVDIPIWTMIAQSESVVRERATVFQMRARDAGIEVVLEPGMSTVGGGSLPGDVLPTTLIRLPAICTENALRRAPTPVVPRVRKRVCLLDLRTVLADEEDSLLGMLIEIADLGGALEGMVDSSAQ